MSMPCFNSPVVGTIVPSASRKTTSPSGSAPRPRHNTGRTELIASINATMSASVKRRRKPPVRGGVRQQLRPEPVHQRHVVTQPVHVLQTGTAGEHAVGEGEHMIGLVIRQVHLPQLQRGVDRPYQTEPAHPAVHGAPTPVGGRPHVAAHLISYF